MIAYVPDAGHVVWLEFDRRAGHELAGRRPVLVVSPARYNGKTGLKVCCPMTTKIRSPLSRCWRIPVASRVQFFPTR